MKTTPLLMTGGNVRLIQQDLKTNTRRVINPQPFTKPLEAGESRVSEFTYRRNKERFGKHPYGNVGDVLALRETFWCWGRWDMSVGKGGKLAAKWVNLTDAAHPIIYDADQPQLQKIERTLTGYHKRPSIYLPKDAWRLKLEITRVEVERLQDISEADARAEGITAGCGQFQYFVPAPEARQRGVEEESPVEAYHRLWDSINGKQRPGKPDISWKANPFVWSIHFKKLEVKP